MEFDTPQPTRSNIHRKTQQRSIWIWRMPLGWALSHLFDEYFCVRQCVASFSAERSEYDYGSRNVRLFYAISQSFGDVDLL